MQHEFKYSFKNLKELKTMHDNETGANYEIKVQDTKITITAHITNSNELRQFQHDLEELAEDILYPTIESSQ